MVGVYLAGVYVRLEPNTVLHALSLASDCH